MLLTITKPRAPLAERARRVLRPAAAAVAQLAADAALAPLRALENRRLVGALGALSDHELRDMGLRRGDVADATALGGARDAGLFLAGRRDAARRH